MLQISAPGSKPVQKTLTPEAQLDVNELLLKLQAVDASNLYVVRKQREINLNFTFMKFSHLMK